MRVKKKRAILASTCEGAKMKRARFFMFALVVALAASGRAQDHAPLKLVATIPLPGLHDGDFDHFAPDVAGHRLLLTGEEHEYVVVLDTSANSVIHTMDDIKAPHAILYRADLKTLFIVEGDASAVREYDSDSYKLTAEIRVSIDAVSIAYNKSTHYLYVVNAARKGT